MIVLTLLSVNVWVTQVEKVIEEDLSLLKTELISLNNIAEDIIVYSWNKEKVKVITTKSIISWGINDKETFLF